MCFGDVVKLAMLSGSLCFVHSFGHMSQLSGILGIGLWLDEAGALDGILTIAAANLVNG